MDSPFFITVFYVDLIIVGIALLIFYFFFIKIFPNERSKLLMGIVSIILGGIIIIVSFLGILNFNIYLGGLTF